MNNISTIDPLILIIGSIIVSFSIVMFTLTIINFFSNNNKWFCDKMGWHKAPQIKGFDGASMNGKCPRCGKSVMQDSQGNWF